MALRALAWVYRLVDRAWVALRALAWVALRALAWVALRALEEEEAGLRLEEGVWVSCLLPQPRYRT